MKTQTIAQKIARIAPFRIEYTLFRSDAHAYFGICCKAFDENNDEIAEYCNPLLCSDEAVAQQLLTLLAEQVVFPTHIEDVLADMRGTLLGSVLCKR